MYAIVKTGGKQFKISKGDIIFTEKLKQEENMELEISEIVALDNGNRFVFDAEELKNARVKARVIKHGKSKKITVFTYKAKKNQKRKIGHRQMYTKLEILEIKEN